MRRWMVATLTAMAMVPVTQGQEAPAVSWGDELLAYETADWRIAQ